jgi:hypothetical protein
VGKHDRKDKDEESQGDGFVGWIPRKPEPEVPYSRVTPGSGVPVG